MISSFQKVCFPGAQIPRCGFRISRPGFQIPQANSFRISDSMRKCFLGSGIQITLHGMMLKNLDTVCFAPISKEVTQEKKSKVHFIKVHAPWEVLLFYAEEMSFRAPLEVCHFSVFVNINISLIVTLSSSSGFKLATSTFVLSILEFIFIPTSHKHCAFTIIFTYVHFGNLSLFARYAMLMRPRNLKAVANKSYIAQG